MSEAREMLTVEDVITRKIPIGASVIVIDSKGTKPEAFHGEWIGSPVCQGRIVGISRKRHYGGPYIKINDIHTYDSFGKRFYAANNGRSILQSEDLRLLIRPDSRNVVVIHTGHDGLAETMAYLTDNRDDAREYVKNYCPFSDDTRIEGDEAEPKPHIEGEHTSFSCRLDVGNAENISKIWGLYDQKRSDFWRHF